MERLLADISVLKQENATLSALQAHPAVSSTPTLPLDAPAKDSHARANSTGYGLSAMVPDVQASSAAQPTLQHHVITMPVSQALESSGMRADTRLDAGGSRGAGGSSSVGHAFMPVSFAGNSPGSHWGAAASSSIRPQVSGVMVCCRRCARGFQYKSSAERRDGRKHEV